MKKQVIDKTNKREVEHFRRLFKRYKCDKEFFKELYGNAKINSLENYEEIHECWGCGEKITFYDEPNERVFCKKCRQIHVREFNKLLNQQSEIKCQIMLEKAIETVENSNSYAFDYKESYDIVKKELKDNHSIYKSSEEIVVAMTLHNYNYEFIPNYKVGKYIVDFYIPELKICLEVDGERHKYHTEYDKNRDMRIRNELGADWEIVRIPTEYISLNPDRIPEAMKRIKKEMQGSRKEYGIIHDNFSKREVNYYSRILDNKKMDKDPEYKQKYDLVKNYFEKKE